MRVAYGYDQEHVDDLARALGWATANEATFVRLTEMSVDESGMGNAEGRQTRRFKVHGVLCDALRTKSVGVIEEIREKGIKKYAQPAGVIAGLLPVTNPVVTIRGSRIYSEERQCPAARTTSNVEKVRFQNSRQDENRNLMPAVAPDFREAKRSMRILVIPIILAASAAIALAQNSSADTVNAHMTAAAKAAGFDHIGLYNTTCARLGDPAGGRAAPPQHDRDPETWGAAPAQVFDHVYWLGEHAAYESHPSAWAVDTSEGIIIIDALHADSVQTQVIGGMQKLGLDPKRIKYVFVTHGHTDHYGGAKYLQDTYGARVMMSGPDWDFIETQTSNEPKPKKDIVLTDGQKFTLGQTTITMYITPFHTPGTISFLMNVTDHGQPHVAAMWGGSGWNFRGTDSMEKKLATFKIYHDCAVRFRQIVEKAGADVVMGNHSYLDLAEQKNALMAEQGPNASNPWILGKQRALNYEIVAEECSAAGLASFR